MQTEQKVIDVSANQGIIEWEKVYGAGIRRAVLRSAVKSGDPDKEFFRNLKGCRDNGIAVEVYKYTYARNTQEAKTEADQVINLLRQAGVTRCFIWWDVEDKQTLAPLGSQTLTDCIRTAMDTVRKAGFFFGIYTGLNFFQSGYFDTGSFDCPYWIARYPNGDKSMELEENPDESKKPDIGGQMLRGWQYTSHGYIEGIAGRVDISLFYEERGKANIFLEFLRKALRLLLEWLNQKG